MSLGTGLESLKRGEFVLLFDSAGRENEIDMVVAAEFITPEHVARMRQNAGGLLCIALEHNFAKSLELQYMHELLSSSSISNKEMIMGLAPYGDYISQQDFIEKLFNFYGQNESEIKFLTWYRYIDQEIDTCVVKDQNIGDQTITVGGGSSLGTSEHVIERLNQYNCNAGIVTTDQNFKSGWNEFKTQIQMLN